jgi:hypothetical protein
MKVVLGSLLTYQIIYWSWLKLESIEKDKEGEGMHFPFIQIAYIDNLRNNNGVKKATD